MPRFIHGQHPVREAIKAGRVQFLYLAPKHDLEKEAQAAKVAFENRSNRELDDLAKGAVHQGAIAIVGDYPYSSLDAILATEGVPLVLVLDGITDPHNLGAIVRSAHVMGCSGIVIAKDRAVQVNGTVVKTSAGATEHVKIAVVTNITRALEELKERGLWAAGAVAEGGQIPWKTDLKIPLALVLGGEGPGIRPLVLRNCDLQLQIPMLGKVASLNVSAAGAMLLYEVARQRAN